MADCSDADRRSIGTGDDSTSPETEKRGHQQLYTLRAALGLDLLDAGQLVGKTILVELRELSDAIKE
jgi:hypothetical protein